MHILAGSTLHNSVTLTFGLFDLWVGACRCPAVECMCAKFGVDSWSRFAIIQRTHAQWQTPLITLSTHRLPPAGVVKLAFHDADTDTDTDFLARILADSPNTSTSPRKSSRGCWRGCRCRKMRSDFLADTLARMSVSVSASWNSSFSDSDLDIDSLCIRDALGDIADATAAYFEAIYTIDICRIMNDWSVLTLIPLNLINSSVLLMLGSTF